MITNRLLQVLLLSGFVLHPSSCLFAQGSLTPSAAPTPTMKTLDQIEPRTPISALPFTISTPGSYYLTGNLTATANVAAITVSADNVTIDLGGFTISGAGKTGGGIVMTGGSRKNLCVRNGTISDWKNSAAIDAFSVYGGTYENLRVLNSNYGLQSGVGATVRACVVSGNLQFGISLEANSGVTDCNVFANGGNAVTLGAACHISNSSVSGNLGAGIYSQSGCSIINCTISANGVGVQIGEHSLISHCTVSNSIAFGIAISGGGTGLTISNCTVVKNGGTGISAGIGSTIVNCTIGENSSAGLEVASRCHVLGNTFEANNTVGTAKQAGVVITGNGNRIDSNNFSANNYAGLFADTGVSGNIVIRNSFRGAQYILPAGNVSGPFVDLSAGGGTIPSTASPWANFGY